MDCGGGEGGRRGGGQRADKDEKIRREYIRSDSQPILLCNYHCRVIAQMRKSKSFIFKLLNNLKNFPTLKCIEVVPLSSSFKIVRYVNIFCCVFSHSKEQWFARDLTS